MHTWVTVTYVTKDTKGNTVEETTHTYDHTQPSTLTITYTVILGLLTTTLLLGITGATIWATHN